MLRPPRSPSLGITPLCHSICTTSHIGWPSRDAPARGPGLDQRPLSPSDLRISTLLPSPERSTREARTTVTDSWSQATAGGWNTPAGESGPTCRPADQSASTAPAQQSNSSTNLNASSWTSPPSADRLPAFTVAALFCEHGARLCKYLRHMQPATDEVEEEEEDEDSDRDALVRRCLSLSGVEAAKQQEVEWSRLGEGQGYLGRCWRCQIKTATGQDSDCSFVVKAPPLPSSPMYGFVHQQRLFQAEAAFYQLITNLEGQQQPKAPRYLFHLDRPSCYRLVLEDKSQGTVCLGLQSGMSLQQCVAAVVEVAKVHAVTYSSVVARWPETAELLADQADLHAELLGQCFSEGLGELRRRAPGLCGGEEEWRVLEDLGRLSSSMTQEMVEGRGGDERRLAHGDFWCGNVLFVEGEGDVVAALLDFQFAAFKQLEWLDVIMMVASSLEAEDRRQGQELVFRAYVEARGDLTSEGERAALVRGLRAASLPIGLCFAIGFGASAVLSGGDGRVLDRIRHLVEDYLAMAAAGVKAQEAPLPAVVG